MKLIHFVLLYILSVILFDSCVEPYFPEIDKQDKNKYVVTGKITDQEGYQIVTISKTTSVQYPKYLPLTGCSVYISDDKNNIFTLDEFAEGQYRVWIGQEFLNPGTSYKVEVTTPSNHEIVSEFDKMTECPEIDTVYYQYKEILTNNPLKPVIGIQFYVDLNAQNTDSRYYKYDFEETWEHHAGYPKEFWYDGTLHQIVPPDSSTYFCWSTFYSNQVFVLSTNSLVQNKYIMFPLHYISNTSPRLLYGYSLLIKQSSLSETAHIYWDQLRINNFEMGGLYERQPIAIKGNLDCINDPNQEVLGFFYAASVKSKRIFIRSVPELILDAPPPCYPAKLWRGFMDIYPEEYPAFVVFDGGLFLLDEPCLNCAAYEGTTIKPDFWPR